MVAGATLTAMAMTFATGSVAEAQVYGGPGGPREVRGYIEQTYIQRYGGPNGVLGGPTTDEVMTPRRFGAFNHFANGSIYWSPGTGAWRVAGAIRSGWAATGWENGPLGFPAGDETRLPAGWWQPFEGGKMMFSPASGSQPVSGWFFGLYAASGSETGPLGYPTSAEFPLVRGGVGQRYQGGVMYASADSRGAHAVRGAILNVWGSIGFERGSYGYPRTDERRNAEGNYYQNFVGGTIVWYRGGYSPLTLTDSLDCDDRYYTQADFQRRFATWGDRYGDVYDLDPDGNGIACG
jgi:uncharacterized protein with LGFP repeats